MKNHRYRITLDLDTNLDKDFNIMKRLSKELIKNNLPNAKNIKVEKIK